MSQKVARTDTATVTAVGLWQDRLQSEDLAATSESMDAYTASIPKFAGSTPEPSHRLPGSPSQLQVSVGSKLCPFIAK